MAKWALFVQIFEINLKNFIRYDDNVDQEFVKKLQSIMKKK